MAAEGLRGAEALGKLLAAAPVRAVYASPLERAQQTARALAAPHGLEVVTDDRLIEWSFWVRWAGTPWAGLAAADPAVADYEEDPGSACPDDPLSEVGTRVLAWAREAADEHEGVVVGVSHEAPLAAAYLTGRGGDFSGFRAVNVPPLGCVRLEPGPPEIVDPVASLHC
ncbi:MAG: histidine phosphatase family protein [Actinobacteria bacterium]|nr:histidine phosphatase family protein [Actinomycetota bacterium]